jgi:hypothetical protein
MMESVSQGVVTSPDPDPFLCLRSSPIPAA